MSAKPWTLAGRTTGQKGCGPAAAPDAVTYSGRRVRSPEPLGLAQVEILRADGRHEEHHVGKHILLDWIKRMIGADCIDTVNLRDGRVMLVDDTGLVDGKPENAEATRLYWSICRPGTTNPICGDVAIALDEDFA